MLSLYRPPVITFIPGTSPALFGVTCHYPPWRCTVFESYSRIFHPLQFLSPREVLHTPHKVTGLPCYFYSLLSGHSFIVALQPMTPLLSLKPPAPCPTWTWSGGTTHPVWTQSGDILPPLLTWGRLPLSLLLVGRRVTPYAVAITLTA